MERTKYTSKPKLPLAVQQQIISEIMSRGGLARRMGFQYGDKRKVYKALGYPDDTELTFEWYYNKYGRQDIARAVIDRPCDATWRGDLSITEPGRNPADSDLNKQWKKLDESLFLKKRLNKVDKLCDLGRYSILLLGLNDVKKKEDFQKPVNGARKLLYVKQIAESEATVHTWEVNTQSPRYGMPVLYQIQTGMAQGGAQTTIIEESQDLIIHYSRVLHYVSGNLTSEVFGVSKLMPIVNRLVDLEKILGGDAEMFWRGARPGYTASAKEDYELGTAEEAALLTELDKYEHDLRRFIVTKGIDIEALEQQVAKPLEHIEVQLQAISAQTGIPKRVLIGSERGELASTQDKDAWKELVKTRQEEHAEPTILRPFINLLMKYGILPAVDDYNVMWDDVFAPSEMDKAKVGKERSDALKTYADSALASAVLPPPLALRYLLGLNEEQVQEVLKAMKEQEGEEASLLAEAEAAAEEGVGGNEEEEEEEEEMALNRIRRNGFKKKWL